MRRCEICPNGECASVSEVSKALTYVRRATIRTNGAAGREAWSPAGPEAAEVREFENAVSGARCPRDRIPLHKADRLVHIFANKPIWGPRRNTTLALAVAEHAASVWGLRPNEVPEKLRSNAENYVDKALGIAPGEMKRFDYGHGTPFYGFILSYVAPEAYRIIEQEIELSEPTDVRDRDGEPDELMEIDQLQTLVTAASSIQRIAIAAEKTLVEAAAERLERAPLPKGKLRTASRAIAVLRAGLSGEAGFCLMLHCEAAGRQVPEINLRVCTTAQGAQKLGGYSNPTKLREQVQIGFDRCLGQLLADVPASADLVPLFRTIIHARREAQALLEQVAGMIDRSDLVEAWRGAPKLERSDTSQRKVGKKSTPDVEQRPDETMPDTGYGIAHVHHPFGLLDPASSDYPNLQKWLALAGCCGGPQRPLAAE